MRWVRAFKDTRGYGLLDRLAIVWLSRGYRGGWIRVGIGGPWQLSGTTPSLLIPHPRQEIAGDYLGLRR